MATEGERIRGLRDFFADSFTVTELEMFLTMNEYGEVVDAVNQQAGGIEYSFAVAQALQRRGLIDEKFFERLREERSGKRARIGVLQQLWTADHRPVSKSSGKTTSSGTREMSEGGPPASQHHCAATTSRVEDTGPPSRVRSVDPVQVFFSYSQKDEKLRDRLEEHLANLKRQGVVSGWHDRKIGAGKEWAGEISEHLESAQIILLLVSSSFLASDYCHDAEMRRALERHDREEARVIPVILRPVDWEGAEFGKLQALPRDAKAVTTWRSRDEAFKNIAEGIRRVVGEFPIIRSDIDDDEGHDRDKQLALDPRYISIGRLMVSSGIFVNRCRELDRLDEAWEKGKVRILSIVAFGGEGKSALVNNWLRKLALARFEGAERVYAWSFYQRRTSAIDANDFVVSALGWFGDHNPLRGNAFEQGERLAALINSQRTLLILDGLEPLQHPPKHEQEGEIKDDALRMMVANLAYMNRGLCVITTRLPVADLASFESSGLADRLELKPLAPKVGASLLERLGVKGDKTELMLASDEFRGHCLSLNLLGTYLHNAFKGMVGLRSKLPLNDEPAQRVLASYEHWLGEGPQLSILRMLAFFGRPAIKPAIQTLRSAPKITGLNDFVLGIDETEWQEALSALRRAKLIVDEPSNGVIDGEVSDDEGTLDAHPMVREYFRSRLREDAPSAWREGSKRLYKYFKDAAPDHPDSPRDMQPLLLSIAYACQAGLYRDAFTLIYMKRVMRGNQFYAANRLGAVHSLLDALSNFFERGIWHLPVSKSRFAPGQSLRKVDQLTLLIQAGTLLSLGRGYADPEVERVYVRADELRKSLGSRRLNPHLFPVMWGLWTYKTVRGELKKAHSIATSLVKVARKQSDRWNLLLAYRMLGDSEFWKGRFESAEQLLAEAVELYRGLAHEPNDPKMPMFNEDPCVMSLGYLAYCQWFRGRVVEGHKTSEEALQFALDLNQPYTLSYAMIHRTVLFQLVGDATLTLDWANRTLQLASRHGFAFQVELASIWLGWAIYRLGASGDNAREIQKGISKMTEHIGNYVKMGCSLLLPHLRSLLAEGFHDLKKHKQSLELTDKAIEQISRTGERYYEPELWRLRGKILVDSPKSTPQDAISCFRRAFECAGQQGSLVFRQRALDELKVHGILLV